MDATYTERDMRDWQRAVDERDAEIARLREALRPFAEFARKFDARPIRGLDDALHNIHGGEGATNDGATLRLSDCRAALKAMGEM